MSMTTLFILRYAGIFAAYTGLTVLLPANKFSRILVGSGLSEQFLMCYTFGKFYIINIVFAVQVCLKEEIICNLLLTCLFTHDEYISKSDRYVG